MARSNVVLLRLDETVDAVRPSDSVGNLGDLTIETGLVQPAIVSGSVGRGRRYVAATGNGHRAQDVVSGSTLLSRDMSIQVIAQWNLAAQNAAGSTGTLYARGKGNSAAEYLNAGLELRVVNAALNVGELRWLWHDAAGALRTQVGAHLVPHPYGFLLLTATRRWISSTEVVLRYFVGDELVTEVTSSNGSIGGGTTGTTSLGARFSGATWGRFFDGVIDELRVVDYEMTPEEVAATYARILVHQPRGYELVKELHDPGFPISDDPASRVQLETRLWGHGLGYASAQAANLRDNVLPDRAYGSVLEQWEEITAQPSKPGDSTDARRARVVARIRQDLGVSIPGIGAALRELVATDPANLEILAFDQTTVDDFTTGPLKNDGRWFYEYFTTDWSIVASQLRLNNGANARVMDGPTRTWVTARMAIGGGGYLAAMVGKLVPTTIASVSEVGFWLGDMAHGNYVLFGLRNTAGVYQFVIEFVKSFASTGVTVLGVGALTTYWLKLVMQEPPVGSPTVDFSPKFTAGWSTVAEAGPYTDVVDIASPAAWINRSSEEGLQWAGLYGRTIGAAVQITVDWDHVRVRAPRGNRAHHFYVYRNPALPGSPDLAAADATLRGLKQAHTVGAVITSKVAICDDPNSFCDLTPIGE